IGGYGGTIAIGTNTAPSGTTAMVTSSLTPPPGPFNPAGRPSLNPRELLYVQLSFSQSLVVTSGIPTFTFTIPSTPPIGDGHFFLAIFDLSQPVPQQLGTIGPASVKKHTLTFSSPSVPLVASPSDTFLATLYKDETSPRVIREIEVTNPVNQQIPSDLALGNDGNMWVTINGGARIDRLNQGGVVAHFPLPSGTLPGEIAKGPDGNLWFAASKSIFKISDAGGLTEFPIPTPGTIIADIAGGRTPALWFTEFEAGKVGRIGTSGEITQFPLPAQTYGPVGIALGADGDMWFTLFNQAKVGRITQTGVISEFDISFTGERPELISAGADGNIWVADVSRIVRVTPHG